MQLLIKFLSLYLVVAIASAQQVPPTVSKCYGQCQVAMGGTSAFLIDCDNTKFATL